MRPISKEIKEMQGTFEPSKEIDSLKLPEWEGSKMPAAEEKWTPRVQKLWNERCRDLFASGYLTAAFLTALKRYCFAVQQAEEAEQALLNEGFVLEKIDVKGNKQQVLSPWMQVLDNANKNIEKYGAKFGFTPLDVQKIPAVKKEETSMSLLK